jgi:hypothetical protein
MTDEQNYVGSSEPDPNLPPGFRVYPDVLSDADAIAAMRTAVDVMVRAALEARYGLLELGFAVDHSLCRELDDTARDYAGRRDVLRRMAATPATERQ